jgi:hypothetical protein
MLLTGDVAGQEESQMDNDYMFLCGVMWCRFGQPEAGKELVRALKGNEVRLEISLQMRQIAPVELHGHILSR